MGPWRSASQRAQSSRQLASSARSGGAEPRGASAAERMNTLMADIRRLGRLPRRRGPPGGDEYKLACRLQAAQRQGHLSEAQLAEIRGYAPPEVPWAERMNTLMAEIRALGHVPRATPSLGEEYKLAVRLREAQRLGRLSEAQLADLAEIPRYAAVPPVAERMPPVVAELAEIP